jgi:hypothetical protein
MSHAHIISSRSDEDPASAFLRFLQILMFTTFALGVAAVVVSVLLAY